MASTKHAYIRERARVLDNIGNVASDCIVGELLRLILPAVLCLQVVDLGQAVLVFVGIEE